MSYFFENVNIPQYRGFDPEDSAETCRVNKDKIINVWSDNFYTQQTTYFKQNGTNVGFDPKQEVIVLSSDGEFKFFVDPYEIKKSDYQVNILGKQCCEQTLKTIIPEINRISQVEINKNAFDENITPFWDADSQSCRIKPKQNLEESCDAPFKIVLNPQGNDGAIFNIGKNDNDCSVTIEFDYLFKLDCAKLSQIMNPNTPDQTSSIEASIISVKNTISKREVTCNLLSERLNTLTEEYTKTSYSIYCSDFSVKPNESKESTISKPIIPLNFETYYVCGVNTISIGVNNITGGDGSYQISKDVLTTESQALSNANWIQNDTILLDVSATVDATYWFAVKDSSGKIITKSVTTKCVGTSTNTKNSWYNSGSFNEVINWSDFPIWYYDVNAKQDAYNFMVIPYTINPINRVKVTNSSNFNKTGFGNLDSTTPFGLYMFGTPKNFCLTETGLIEWEKLLGTVNYKKFIDGDASSYTCKNVIDLFKLQESTGRYLMYECTTAFGDKSNLKKLIDDTIITSQQCTETINELKNELSLLESQATSLQSCKTITEALESLDVSVSLDVIESNGTLTSVYEYSLFPSIGIGNLYDYLLANQTNSGFYICGTPNSQEEKWAGSNTCIPIVYEKQKLYGPSVPLGFYLFDLVNPELCKDKKTSDGDFCNVSSCRMVKDSLYQSLINESGYDSTELETFKSSLTPKIFSSEWLSYSEEITDDEIIEKIKNKKLTISLKVNNTCSDICVLLDNIKLNRDCVNGTKGLITLTQSPGFNLRRVIDNKKSWVNNTSYVDREFLIANSTGGTQIRNTSYGVFDERLVINSKEIDLDMNIASAIETDVWCYINKNNDILGIYDNICSGQTINSCGCGADCMSFTSLTTTDLTNIDTAENFTEVVSTEMIDVKNRKTISNYATLRALYDRYLTSSLFTTNVSLAYTYDKMNALTKMVGNYWSDVVEQVVPSTTIWGSTKIYANTVFDQQKFQYKKGNLYTCMSNVNINEFKIYDSNPCVENTNITAEKPVTIKCCGIYMKKIDIGSEFIGSVNVSIG